MFPLPRHAARGRRPAAAEARKGGSSRNPDGSGGVRDNPASLLEKRIAVIQRYKVSGLIDGDGAAAVTKAVETLQMVERALIDVEASELIVEGEAEEQAIRDLVAAAGFRVTGRA